VATKSPPAPAVTLADVQAARERTTSLVRRTPLIHSAALSRSSACDVWLKAECLQRTGSFKVRGAANRIALLSDEERERGVVAASAGNHAQGVAVAATAAGVEASIVMPTLAPLAKVEATRGYGADVVLFGQDYGAAAEYAREVAARPAGPVLIHAFNDPGVIAGQGTLGLELLKDMPQVANVVIPVGGGGLAGGTALALKEHRPSLKVFGVQAAAAPGVYDSYKAGQIVRTDPRATLADGVAVAAPGENTLPLLTRYLDDVVTVDEEAISQAIVFLLERSKLVVEGAGAIGVAALMREKVPLDGPTIVVLTGGNLDINTLARIVEHGLTHVGRYFELKVGLEDRPGRLSQMLQLIADSGANVLTVEHQRAGIDLPVGRVEVKLLLEVRSPLHGSEVMEALCRSGFARTPDGDPRHVVPVDWLF
jgi:threonine dehydratase